jgi:predicted SAM-dependent methyltransferase
MTDLNRRWNKVHLGCHTQLKEGFLNLDILDLQDKEEYLMWDFVKNGLPEQVENISYVYSSHVLEHIKTPDAIKLMQECFSKMVPGGVFRVCLPDFFQLYRAYVEKDWKFYEIFNWNDFSDARYRTFIDIVEWSNYQYDPEPCNEHKSNWDQDKFEAIAKFVGFSQVNKSWPDPSIDSMDPVRTKFSFYVDAIK